MDYHGRYPYFDRSAIATYPIATRRNKVTLADLINPTAVPDPTLPVDAPARQQIQDIAQAIRTARAADKPVIIFTGAHLIKNGLSPLLIDLVQRDLINLVAGNGATSIHDVELALIGQTSEHVPQDLEQGRFGMAYEFCYHNLAVQLGNERGYGYGESLGRMICNADFRSEVSRRASANIEFQHPQVSLLRCCYERHVPFTVHVGIGTDVIDQHPSFDGRAKGGCSGRDFLIFTEHVCQMTQGGVVLNIGSAVTGPEVLLKAVSMAANVGKAPAGLITADFDLRQHHPAAMNDEQAMCYYFRDQKSVVTRVPAAYHGHGYYVQGDQRQTIPALYRELIRK